MKRRDFIKTSVPLTASLASGYWSTIDAAVSRSADMPVPKRAYKDGVQLSIVGFGGIVLVGQSQEAGNREVSRAVARGINYFDVAPTYGDGEAERKLGPALKPHRDRVFLACKTNKRSAKKAQEELENSLRTLKTDYFDLYQLHNMHRPDDIEEAFSPGGVMEVLTRARKEGKVRYLGFSAHDEDVALELLDRFEFDSVLYPVNYVCYATSGFGPALLKKARERNVARLALKALAYTPWDSRQQRLKGPYPKCWYEPISDLEKARSALRFTLSEDVTSAIPPGDERIYRIAESLAAEFQPLSREERMDLLASARDVTPLFPRPA